MFILYLNLKKKKKKKKKKKHYKIFSYEYKNIQFLTFKYKMYLGILIKY